MMPLVRRASLHTARLADIGRGLIVLNALLTAGCVMGYRDLPADRGLPSRRQEVVGQYLTLARCKGDPKVERCEGVIRPSFSRGLRGVTGSVAWQVVEMKAGGDGNSSWSSFVLVLTETNGSTIRFTRIEKYVYGGGRGDTRHDVGLWSLPANGELRLPFASRGLCQGAHCRSAAPPSWEIVLMGKDERDQDVRVAMKILLPSDLH